MSRDKQIEEMARDICHLTVSCEECVMLARKTGRSKKQYCKAMQYAERAYNAGYRKASDIFEEIEEGVKAGISALQFETNHIHRKVKHETYSSIMRYIKTLEDKYESEGEG